MKRHSRPNPARQDRDTTHDEQHDPFESLELSCNVTKCEEGSPERGRGKPPFTGNAKAVAVDMQVYSDQIPFILQVSFTRDFHTLACVCGCVRIEDFPLPSADKCSGSL